MEGTLAQILFFAGNFAPRNWAFCDGQLISISENTALFSLLGTIYGGDGETTFALPDCRGRLSVGAGTGPGLPPVSQGARFGAEQRTLTEAQMPIHNHAATATVQVATGNATTDAPDGNIFAAHGDDLFAAADTANGTLAATSLALAPAGGNVPFSVVQPVVAVNHVICTTGIFPSPN